MCLQGQGRMEMRHTEMRRALITIWVQLRQQLRHLLKNYDALVEGQHHLLNQSITKMAKIPPPDEITATFNRFQVLKDSELDDFRSFLDDHKQILTQQYRDFD